MMISIWAAVSALQLTAGVPGVVSSVRADGQSAPGVLIAPSASAGPGAGGGDGDASPEATVEATPVVPPTADDDQRPPKEKPGFGGTFILDNSLPSGAFITNNAYTFNPALTTNLYLRPAYTFKAWGQTMRAEVWENFYVNDILDKNSVDTRRFDWSDARLSLYDDKVYEEPHSKIILGAFVRGAIPLSYESQYETKITTLSAGVNLKKNLYRFNLQLGVQASKNFTRYTTASFPCSASAVGPVAVVPGEAPDVSSVDVITGFENGACSSNDPAATASFTNVDWSVVPNGSVAYNFTDKLQLSLALYYFDQFKYPIGGNSQFDSQKTDTNGNLVVTDNGRSDGIWGITELSYNLDEHWSLALGLWNAALPSGVPPKTADNKDFRFPFFDTHSFNSNDWNVFLDLTASL